MKIIQPAHSKKATLVKDWNEIKEDAKELRDFINNGKFDGHYDKAFAISHAQVSENPKHFFVVNKEYEKLFGTWCVINQSLAPKKGMNACREPGDYEEACMSFPFRKPKKVERFYKIRVKYYKPSLFGLVAKIKDLEGLAALIVQHESGHNSGRNIYNL